ncbi:DNA cytosine methyltransferase [Cetobacterium sp.]|uniref:DNA cytosine methyltransferase n=1 Tax=Cetobacterium sp. TaxID=2071632 RepID=UPI003F4167EF
MKKYNVIDLFAGCGGLLEGFLKEGSYNPIASVEWKEEPLANLKNRLEKFWKIENVTEKCLKMDMQKIDFVLNGWENDSEYGDGKGLDYLVNKNGNKVDLVIGGPPCQAYSLAGRIRDENGMKEDYRNFLFESYLEIVKKYKPKLFIFENVEGLLSAKPGEKKVVDLISQSIEAIDYHIISNLKDALIDLSEYGIPQSRKRVIILGVSKGYYADSEEVVQRFYKQILKEYKVSIKSSLKEAIVDLPKLYPTVEYKKNKKKYSHRFEEEIQIKNHEPRFHNQRDIEIFKKLAEDIESKTYRYKSSEAKNQLYFEKTGKKTNVHKYHVLDWYKPSTTICAHLKKDGLRFIHPDSSQARTLTVRETARIQTFDDTYEFISSQGANYEMIGNAVPPKFSYILAKAVKELL